MITNDFVLSFAIAGGTIIVQKIIEPIFEGQELNMPNGNYTVETITRTEEFGSFTKLTESFELYYGETDDGYILCWIKELETNNRTRPLRI